MFLKHMSLKSKLVLMLLGIAMGSIIVVGYQGLSNGKQALTNRIDEQLTNVRESKRSQIQAWFEDITRQVSSITGNYTVMQAMSEFSAAYKRTNEVALTEPQLKELETFYTEQFFPTLASVSDEAPELEHYLPKSLAAQYLQYQYIVTNEFPLGGKDKLDKANDKSYYSSVHDHYHPMLRDYKDDFGFYDLFLIDLESQSIVYSVFKETDYATSLQSGIYRTSNLANLVRKLSATQKPGDIQLIDFDFYAPSGWSPAAFMGSTIFNQDKKAIGFLVIQVPIDRLNAITTGQKGWKEQGLGESGEVFVVSSDRLMRSDARLILEKKECYATTLVENNKMDATTAKRICDKKTSILLQKMESKSVGLALNGESGTATEEGYAGKEVRMAYAPLILPNMKMAIVSQIDVDEANAPVRAFQKELGISTVIISSVVTFLAMMLATIFTKPITELMKGVKKLSKGETDLEIALDRHDEYGQLAKTLNSTASMIKEQQDTIKQKEGENYQLLLNTLPEKYAQDYQMGIHKLAERINNVSVIYTNLIGFSEVEKTIDPEKAVDMLNTLIGSFDKAAKKYGVEKIKTCGDSYIGACGLHISRLDHGKRCVDMGIELIKEVQNFNREYKTHLSVRVGINSGSVLAGMVGTEMISYDIWGSTVHLAQRIRFETYVNTIIITKSVYDRLAHKDIFEENKVIETKAMGVIETWSYNEFASDDQVAEDDVPVNKTSNA